MAAIRNRVAAYRRPRLIDQAQETNLMAMITMRDGTRIFYKDWGPKEAQPIMFHHAGC